MPSKYRVRSLFRPLVNLIAKGFYKSGIQNPNVITGLMFGSAVLSTFFLIYLENLLFFWILVFITGIFDGVDGSLRRISNRSSQKGALLDSTLDRFSEIVIFFGIFIYCSDKLLFGFIDMKLIIYLSIFSTLMISYSRTRGENIIKGDFDIGLMARSERLLFLVIASILSVFWTIFNELLFIYMLLVASTAIFRFLKIHKIISAEK